MNKYGALLAELRKNLGLTVAEVASEIEVSQELVLDIEAGRSIMPSDFLQKMSYTFPLPLSWYPDEDVKFARKVTGMES